MYQALEFMGILTIFLSGLGSGQRIHISVSLINALTIHKLIITECTKIQVGLERVILTIQYMLLVLLTCANLTLEKNVSA